MPGDLDQQLRERTNRAIINSFWRYRKREEPEIPEGYRIMFLGTGGNPEATFTQQPRTAGFILDAAGVRLYVDPGPGAVVRARQMNIDLGSLDAVYISHGHLDHYGGVEGVVEAMCWAMYARRGYLLAPPNVLETERLVSYYHQGASSYGSYKGGPEVIPLKKDKPVKIKDAVLTPAAVYHSNMNFGFVLKTKKLTIGYTSDTNYICRYSTPSGVKEVGPTGPIMDITGITEYRRDLKEIFSAVDVLVANVTSHNAWAHRHLTTIGLAHLLKNSKVKLCFLTHFNHSCVTPADLRPLMARYVQEATGVKTVAAYDGAVHDVESLMEGLGAKT
ncbi:MAG: MBL fold metallo-hydrolase [Desulfotomaculum sp.]|nr:MBL fold metallo-hydrolase [Desulfotomaculum sp.]